MLNPRRIPLLSGLEADAAANFMIGYLESALENERPVTPLELLRAVARDIDEMRRSAA